MYQLILCVQCASIVALFAESWVVFKNWKGALQSFLFFSCTATLVNNIGYFFELRAHSEEAYFTALSLSYLGRVWIPFALLLFVGELTHYRIPRAARAFLALVSAATYIAVVTTRSTGLYYTNSRFEMKGLFPDFVHENGIWHQLYTLMLIFYVAVGLFMLVSARRKARNPIARKQMTAVIVAIFVQGVSLVIELFKVFPVTEVYDVTMIGYPLAAVFMFIAIFRYKLLDTEALAKEYVMDKLSEGIIAVDGQGELRFFNRPALELFPKLQSDAPAVIKQLSDAIAADAPLTIQDRIYTPQKNILFQENVISGAIYAIIDDTEHYRYMEELKEQKYLADQANTAKSAFLANMSHEIRTPINAVLGMDEMILRESEEENTLTYADNIRTAGTTLLGLINDILDFSKIEAGKMEIIPVDYDAAVMLSDLVRMIGPRAQGKGLRLVVDVDPKLPCRLHGDEIRIRQVVTNILTNAVKYTEKGSVTFAVSFEKYDGESIGLRISVKDTGIGIKDEDRKKLFSAFERIEEERNRSVEGTGLGMNITKQLLSMMGSGLEVESTYGEGSVFSFTVRQGVVAWDGIGDFEEALRKARAARKRYRESFRAPEGKILVVDDTPMNLTVIQGLLKRTQLSVVTAEKGEEAIRLAKLQDFDVVFLDHRMPDMDGVETLRHLREETPVGQKGTPVVCLTANAVTGAKEEYLAAGFTDYLTKPIEPEKLEEMLIRYLPEEKVHLTDDAVQTDGAMADNAARPEDELFTKLAGVDVENGIHNCGSYDNYLETLRTMSENLLENIAVVEQTKASADWTNYTIKVHAIKSSMRIIGATRLSVLAEGLEAAGDAGDLNRIDKETPELLAQLRCLADELAELFQSADDGKDRPLLEPTQLEEIYQCIREFAAAYDADSLDMILETVRGHRIPDAEKERMDAVRKAAVNLDWNELEKLTNRSMKES